MNKESPAQVARKAIAYAIVFDIVNRVVSSLGTATSVDDSKRTMVMADEIIESAKNVSKKGVM